VTGRRRALALLVPTACVAAIAAVPAGAALQLGGSVPQLIAVAIGAPTSFKHVPGGDVYELEVPVRVTSTVRAARLSVADGENFQGRARGRLRDGSRVASAPLTVATGNQPPQALSAPTDPVLETWTRAVTLAPAPVAIRQALPGGMSTAANFHKMVLITISSDTP
jgi:hypothetical protein